MRYKFYHEVVNHIKKSLPLNYPISVRRVKTSETINGDCYLDEDKQKFLIRINKKLSQSEAVFTFLHEMGHAISWHKTDEDHGKTFGIGYAAVYRIYEKILDEYNAR